MTKQPTKKSYDEIVSLLVYGYIHVKSSAFIPVDICHLIFKFHGTYDVRFESDILSTIQDKMKLMRLLCKQLNNNRIELNRLYSGKIDGFDGSTFHSKCDNNGATISLIINKYSDAIFGGYTSIPWSSDNGNHIDSKAFLFQVKPNQKIILQKFIGQITSVIHMKNNLCGYGGTDLFIRTKCNVNSHGGVCSPNVYAFNTPTDLVGSVIGYQGFKVKNIEIFKVSE